MEGHDWKAVRAWLAKAETPEAKANGVVELFGFDVPPIPVEEIAVRLRVPVHRVKKQGWSGATNSNESAAAIWVSADEAPVRQRFTIAHELGHLFMHPLGQMFRDNPSFSGGPMEREANRFAATLLMPLWMVEPLIIAKRSLGDLAKIFNVSSDAMSFQLEKLSGW